MKRWWLIVHLKTVRRHGTIGFMCFCFQMKNLKNIKLHEKHLKPIVLQRGASFACTLNHYQTKTIYIYIYIYIYICARYVFIYIFYIYMVWMGKQIGIIFVYYYFVVNDLHWCLFIHLFNTTLHISPYSHGLVF